MAKPAFLLQVLLYQVVTLQVYYVSRGKVKVTNSVGLLLVVIAGKGRLCRMIKQPVTKRVACHESCLL